MAIDVEWKSLPPELMYKILNFPALIKDAESYIGSVYEYQACPPDYEEYFLERIIKFSELGLKAIEISDRLRKIGKLPEASEQEEGWSRKEILSRAKAETLAIVEEMQKQQHEVMKELAKYSKN